MKLNNLDISSEIQIAQQDGMNIKFDLTRGTVPSTDFYNLIFYQMLNGIVSGVSSGETIKTGISFIFYDQNDEIIYKSYPVHLKKITTERFVELSCVETKTLIKKDCINYLTRVDVVYCSDRASYSEQALIFSSLMPQKTTFAELTDGSIRMGTALPLDCGDINLTCSFVLTYK